MAIEEDKALPLGPLSPRTWRKDSWHVALLTGGPADEHRQIISQVSPFFATRQEALDVLKQQREEGRTVGLVREFLYREITED